MLAITLLMVMAVESPISAALAECTTIVEQIEVTDEKCGFRATWFKEEKILRERDFLDIPSTVKIEEIYFSQERIQQDNQINFSGIVDFNVTWKPSPSYERIENYNGVTLYEVFTWEVKTINGFELKNKPGNTWKIQEYEVSVQANNPSEYNKALEWIKSASKGNYKITEETQCENLEPISTEICTVSKPECSGELFACKGLNWDCRTDCVDLSTTGQCITSKSDPWTIDYSWGSGGSWFCDGNSQDEDIPPPPIEDEEYEEPEPEKIEPEEIDICQGNGSNSWQWDEYQNQYDQYQQEYENYQEEFNEAREKERECTSEVNECRNNILNQILNQCNTEAFRAYERLAKSYQYHKSQITDEMREAIDCVYGFRRQANETCGTSAQVCYSFSEAGGAYPSSPTRPIAPVQSGGADDPCDGGGEPIEPECNICEAMGLCKDAIENLQKSIESWMRTIQIEIKQNSERTASELQQNRDYLSWIMIRIGQTNDILGIIRDALFEIIGFDNRLNNIEWYQGQLAIKTNQLIEGIQEVEEAVENIAIEFPEIVFPEPPEDIEYDYSQPLAAMGQALETVDGTLLAVKDEIDTSLAEVIDEVGGELELINTELVTLGTGLVEIRNEIDTSLAAVESWLNDILLAIEGIELGVVDEEGTEITIGKLFEINLEKLGDINATLEVELGNIFSKIAGVFDLVTSVLDLLSRLLPDPIVSWLEDIYYRLADVIDAIENIQVTTEIDLSEVIEAINNIRIAFDDEGIIAAIEDLTVMVEIFYSNMVGYLLGEIAEDGIQTRNKLDEVITAIENIKITVGEISTGDVIVDFSPIVNLLSSINGKIDGIQETLHQIWLILHGGRGEGLISQLDGLKTAIENLNFDTIVDVDLQPLLDSIQSNTEQVVTSIESLKTEIQFPEYPEYPEFPQFPEINIDLTQLEETTNSIDSWAEKIHIELTKKPELPELEDCVDLPEWYEPGLSLPPLASNREYCPYEPGDEIDDDDDNQCTTKPSGWVGEPPPAGEEWCEDEVDICVEKPPDYEEGDVPPGNSQWCEDEPEKPGLKVCPTDIWNDDPFPVHLMARLSTKFPLDIVGNMPEPISDDNLVIEFFGVEENVAWFVDGIEILKYPVWLSFVIWVLVSL